MLSVQFLVLPLTTSKNAGAGGYYGDLESLILKEGYSIRMAQRGSKLPKDIHRSDVVLLEVGSTADIQYAQALREQTTIPVLLYGAGVPSSTWTMGLNAGADAFLALPGDEVILRARLQALLRRIGLVKR